MDKPEVQAIVKDEISSEIPSEFDDGELIQVKHPKQQKTLKFKFPDSANVIIFNASGYPKNHNRLADSLNIYFPKAKFKAYEKEKWEYIERFGNFEFTSILYSSIEYESVATEIVHAIPKEQDLVKYEEGKAVIFPKNNIRFGSLVVDNITSQGNPQTKGLP